MQQYLCLMVVVLYALGYSHAEDNDCVFPNYLLNDPNDSNDFWELSGDGLNKNVQMMFHKDVWTVMYDGVVINNATCIDSMTGEGSNGGWSEVFITYNISDTDSLGSMCLQFISRTDNVVQMKTAKMNETDIEDFSTPQCYSELQLIERPLIANTRRTYGYQNCPVTGGFNLFNSTYVEKTAQEEICTHPIHGLLESECTPGEAMTLTFSDNTCVPPKTGWTVEQTLFCLDSWQNENGIQFSILGHDFENPQYSMRIDDDHMLIFLDMACPDGEPSNLTTYISMDYIQKNVTYDVLRDEQTGALDCSRTDYCQLVPFKLACRESCQYAFPDESCEYDDSIVPQSGEWLMERGMGIRAPISQTFNFTPASFSVTDLGQFTCHKKMLDHTYLNHLEVTPGCSSRFACSKFSRVSPSVLQYKFSQFERDYKETSLERCSDSSFHDDMPPLNNLIRSRDYNILIAKDESLLNQTIDCGFSGNYNVNMSFIRSGKVHCTGTMADMDNCKVQQTVDITVECDNGYNTSQSFDCIGAIDFGSSSTKALITRGSQEMPATGHCWVLKSRNGDESLQFYVLNSPQCDVSTLDSIETGERLADANVTATKVDICDEPPAENPSTSPEFLFTTMSEDPDDSTDEERSSSTATNKPTTTTDDEGVNPPKDPDNGPSAGQVVGIVTGVIAGCVLVAIIAWFGVREYNKRKSPYRVL